MKLKTEIIVGTSTLVRTGMPVPTICVFITFQGIEI